MRVKVSERIVASLSINQLKPRPWDHGGKALKGRVEAGESQDKGAPDGRRKDGTYILRGAASVSKLITQGRRGTGGTGKLRVDS